MTDIEFDEDKWLDSYKTSRWKAIKLAWGMITGSNSLHAIWEQATPVQVSGPSRAKRDEYWRGVLGNALVAIEQGYMVLAEREQEKRDTREFPRWSFTCTLFDAVDRGEGAPPRIHINTPWRHVIIALGPHGKIGHWPGKKDRVREDYLGGYLILQRYPHQICKKVVCVERDLTGNILGYRSCPLPRKHTGPCWNWKDDEEIWTPRIQVVDK